MTPPTFERDEARVALEHQEGRQNPEQHDCPNLRGFVYMNPATGETRPARCQRNDCYFCLVKNAHRRSLACAWARPQRELRVSLLADEDSTLPWPTAQRRWNRIREYMKRYNAPLGETALFVERGRRSGMIHGHVMQRGGKVDQRLLSVAASRAGAGLCSVSLLESADAFAAYVLKDVNRWPHNLAASEATARDFLALNGGRLGHFSRSFFMRAGVRHRVRDAEKVALEQKYGRNSETTWVLVPTSAL